MKRFFLELAKIIVLTFLIAYGIQLLADFGLKNKEQTLYHDWEKIVEGKVNAEVLILGSSRGFVSYDPRIIENKLGLSTINLSINAGCFDIQQKKLQLYLKHNKKPKYIIQNVDLPNFGKTTMLPDEDQFIPFLNDSSIKEMILSYDSKYAYIGYFPLLKYNQSYELLKQGVLSNFTSISIPNRISYNGFSPNNYPFQMDHHNLKKMQEKIKLGIDRNEYKKNVQNAIAFYNATLGKSVEIIFVWAPENKERLKKEYDPLRNPLLYELRHLKQSNHHFIDFSNDAISMKNGNYYDSFHLNAKGAHLFTSKLADTLVSIVKNR